MTTPPPLSCLHWGSDGELALEDYLDLPMGLFDIDPDLRQAARTSELDTCPPRANIRQILGKIMETPCAGHQESQKIAQKLPPKRRAKTRRLSQTKAIDTSQEQVNKAKCQ